VSSAVGEAFFQELLWVHGMIRQDLETVRELAAQVAGGLAPAEAESQVASLAANGPLWALKVNCLHYCRFVHGHHRLEDAALFPVLREADPDLAPLVDRLEGDHRRVSEQLDEVEAAVLALNGDEGERTRVVESLNTLADDLLAHLEREEEGIGPALRRLDRHPLSPRS
jgi:iron-sulfur cluster repair protein YtfE (RIC family)